MKPLLSSIPYEALIRETGVGAFLEIAGTLQGLGGVELLANHLPGTGQDMLHSVRRHGALYGLTVAVLAVQSDFGFQEDSEREAEMTSAGNWAEAGAALGAQILGLRTGRSHGRERDFVELVRCLTVTGLLVEETGLHVSVENDVGEEGLITTAAELENLVDSVENTAVGLSAGLTALQDADPYAMAARLAPRALYLRVPVGDGQVDPARLGRLLRDAGFHRYLILEPAAGTEKKALEEFLQRLFND